MKIRNDSDNIKKQFKIIMLLFKMKIILGSYAIEIHDEYESQGHEEEVGLAPLPEGKVACLKCGKTLSNAASGKRHYALSHQPNQPVRCNICKKVCKNKIALNTHLRNIHKVTPAMMKNIIKPPTPPSSINQNY